ncbi:MAG: FGGY-family carbohydrate kinase [Adhaeribacter sp.]
MSKAYFIGIDIGTQGARVVLLDSAGNQAGSREEAFPLDDRSREEQDPAHWWAATERCGRDLLASLAGSIPLSAIKAVSVTSTSGTVIPLDEANQPLHAAIMYSDKRSGPQGKICREAALKHHPQGYTGFNASSGLSKMLWFAETFPEKAARISRWIHAADFITGKLSGNWGITDYTNALKSGYDVQDLYWPAYIREELGIKEDWLPRVVAPGTPIGRLEPDLARAWGLPAQVQVVAGMTDGCASQVASGAVNLGDWNTTIGTTLVVKGVTRTELKDPHNRFYSHRHPEGYWMPGGASNTGADWVTQDFAHNLAALSEQAAALSPSGLVAYPLRQEGERFPFVAPQARGFGPENSSEALRFVANLEGVAYLERYAFELVTQLSGEQVQAVYTAGGGSNSEVWLQIRSNVLNKPLYKMRHVSGAVGAAILASCQTHFRSLGEAARALSQVEKQVLPQVHLVERYESGYQLFLSTLRQKGYIRDHQLV